MTKNLLMPSSKSVFNYTVLLDDLIEPLQPTSPKGSFTDISSLGPSPCNQKFQFSECPTTEVTFGSDRDGDPESPFKINQSKISKCQRLRKSDGALPWLSRNKHSEMVKFLTDESDNEEPFSFDEEESGHVCETKSTRSRGKRSMFSLASCFKNNFSHFGQNSFASSKLNMEFPSKIRRKKLKTAFKGRHFERVVARLSLAIENGGTCTSNLF